MQNPNPYHPSIDPQENNPNLLSPSKMIIEDSQKENNPAEQDQIQFIKPNSQDVSQNDEEIPSIADLVLEDSKGPRILFYGSCEFDQFYVGGGKYIIERPFEITNHFAKLDRSVYSVTCGSMHTLILLTNGEVYSLGVNDDGALGRNTEEGKGKKEIPGKVDLPVPIDMISAGDSNSMACNSANSMIFQWGAYRNILKGNISKVTIPTRIGEKELGKKKIKKILSGDNHTLVLADGKVFAWGDSECGILGRLPIERRLVQQGLNIEGLGVRNVENIFTGAYHSFLTQRKKRKSETGEEEDYSVLLAWGLNNYGQLGIGTTENTYVPTMIKEFEGVEIKDVKGGEHHTIVLTSDGELYGFGNNVYGQAGVGKDLHEKEEEENDKEKMMVEEEEEKEERYKRSMVAKPVKLGLGNVDKIFSGSNYNYAIDRDNKVYSWGMGDNYLLGNKKEETVEKPTEIDENFFKGKAIMFGLGAQHVVSLVMNDVAERLALDENVMKVTKNAVPEMKVKKNEGIEEEEKQVEFSQGRKGRKRRTLDEDDDKELKKVKKTGSSRSVSKSEKKHLKTKRI